MMVAVVVVMIAVGAMHMGMIWAMIVAVIVSTVQVMNMRLRVAVEDSCCFFVGHNYTLLP